MKNINVKASSSYDILIEKGLLNHSGGLIYNQFKPCRVCIITDKNVAPLYSNTVISSLKANGFNPLLFIIEAGESSKSLLVADQIYNFLADNKFSRSDIIIALGGGVVGDIAGFIASTYNRGITLIQMPTSFLAQIDSSVGGKNGVNLNQGKNLVGTFYQPSLVLIDPEALTTLHRKYFIDGIAEAIKCACIKDKELFEILKRKDISNSIEEIIFRCISIKKELVEKDELDKGERMLLNFGHTIGHALEQIYNYEKLSHGQAISIGMTIITRASENIGLTKKGCLNKIISLLKQYSLLTTDKAPIEKIFKATEQDKKLLGGNINLILIKDIGEGFINQIPSNKFFNFLAGGI